VINLAHQRGVALVLVLWLSVLLTITVGSFAIVARTETLQARHLFETTQARYAAESGLHRAVYELRRPDIETRWFSDGRSYQVKFEEYDLEIRIRDESGKIDINVADETILGPLFDSIGLDELKSDELVDAIMDWRDPDDLVRLNGAEDDDYEAAGYSYGAKDAPFDTVSEVQQVLGMNYELYSQIEPSITVYTGRANPEPAFAPLEVLRTFDGFDDETAQQFIDEREQVTVFGEQLPVLPDGTTPLARGGGYTYSVRAKATLPSGTWSEVEATIRLGGVVNGRPFRIVRWKGQS